MPEEVNKEQTKGAEQVEGDELSEDQLQDASGGGELNSQGLVPAVDVEFDKQIAEVLCGASCHSVNEISKTKKIDDLDGI